MTLHKKRTKVTEYRNIPGYGIGRVKMRYDDSCNNGQDTFSITVSSKAGYNGAFGGCMHEQIAKVWPELAKFIPFHLVSDAMELNAELKDGLAEADYLVISHAGPMHYIANTVYHAENGNLKAARNTAIAPDATRDQLTNKNWLKARLPTLMAEFDSLMSEIEWDVVVDKYNPI